MAKQVPRAAKFLAGTVDGVDPAAAARNAGAEVSVAEVQQVKTQLQAGSSGLVGRFDQWVGTFTEEEYKAALKVACLVSDGTQFVTADDDEERGLIVNGQGESFGAKTAAVVGLTKGLVEMKDGSDAEKAAAGAICLGAALKYGN